MIFASTFLVHAKSLGHSSEKLNNFGANL